MRRENEKQILNILEAIARIETSSKWESGCALLAARLVRRISHLFVYHFSHTVDVDLYGRHFNFTGKKNSYRSVCCESEIFLSLLLILGT